jgi:hypothetical protein
VIFIQADEADWEFCRRWIKWGVFAVAAINIILLGMGIWTLVYYFPRG